MKAVRRPIVVLVAGLLAVLWVVGVPPASAQTAPTLNYSIRTSGADPLKAHDGDPLRITISGLPFNAYANLVVCPSPLRDSLLMPKYDPVAKKANWVPDHRMGTRVFSYCRTTALNDELSGSQFRTPQGNRYRSATSGDIVFDTYVPRGSSLPGGVNFDPDYTGFPTSANFPWANNPNGNKYSFTCDDTHPCTMMLEIAGMPAGATTNQTVYDESVKFAASAPGLKIQGCGGVSTGTLTASMPERFGKTAVAWNQMLCAPTRATQPTNIVAETEDTGLNSFDTGGTDVVVSGSGGALASQSVRKRQYVPVGLNATVIAAIGWSPTDRTDTGAALLSRLSTNLAFNWDDIANMLSKGGEQAGTTGRGGIFQNGSPLVLRNPALAAISGTNGPVDAPDHREGYSDPTFYGVTGEAGKSTVPLTLSSMLTTAAPNSWIYGIPNFEGKGGKPVGAVTDLNDLNLGLRNVHNVEAKTGRLAVRKAVNDATVGGSGECPNGCVNWVVTDLVSAAEYGWTPVAVPNGHGGFVAPTPQSLQASAAHMKTAADGSLALGDTSGDPNAYPLTFVESLTAPVNPLIDQNCQPEKAKQDQLATFVKAAVNGGQSSMGPGMVPLTPELLSQAQDAATKVGTGTAPSACAEKAAAQNPGAAAPTTPLGTDILSGGSSGIPAPGLPGPMPLGIAAGTPTTTPAGAALPNDVKAPTTATVLDAKNVAQSIRIPVTGARVLGALIPLLALVILVMLPSATAYLSAGRPVPPWLTRFLQRLGDRVSRLSRRVRSARFASLRGDA